MTNDYALKKIEDIKKYDQEADNIIEKQAEDPSPFRGGDECRTLFSHPIAIYPLGYI